MEASGSAASHALCMKLTFYADDLWPVPLAVGATLSGGNVALQEAVGALVTHHGVDVIVGTLPTDEEGVVHGGRSAAEDCRGQETQYSSVPLVAVSHSAVKTLQTQGNDCFYMALIKPLAVKASKVSEGGRE